MTADIDPSTADGQHASSDAHVSSEIQPASEQGSSGPFQDSTIPRTCDAPLVAHRLFKVVDYRQQSNLQIFIIQVADYRQQSTYQVFIPTLLSPYPSRKYLGRHANDHNYSAPKHDGLHDSTVARHSAHSHSSQVSLISPSSLSRQEVEHIELHGSMTRIAVPIVLRAVSKGDHQCGKRYTTYACV